jgi:hypothetical protein
MDFGESFGGFEPEDGGLGDWETETLESWRAGVRSARRLQLWADKVQGKLTPFATRVDGFVSR